MLDLIERRLLANVQAAREETTDALDRLHGIFIRHIRFIREGRAIPQIIFSDDMHSGSPQRKARVAQIVAAYLGQIRRCVEEGQQQGGIRSDLDPDTAALMFLGTIVPAGMLWHLTDGGFDVTRHAGPRVAHVSDRHRTASQCEQAFTKEQHDEHLSTQATDPAGRACCCGRDCAGSDEYLAGQPGCCGWLASPGFPKAPKLSSSPATSRSPTPR